MTDDALARALIDMGVLSPGQMANIRAEVEARRARSIAVGLRELLIERDVLSRSDLDLLAAQIPRTTKDASGPPLQARKRREVASPEESMKTVTEGTPGPESAIRHEGRIGRYLDPVPIGRGGMGAVFRALDTDLDRPVAVKVLLPEAAERTSVQRRFVDEARITGRLEHPNIPPLHELSSTSDGRVYFTMKLIQGKSLAERIEELAREGPAALAASRVELLGALVKVCDALAFAHSKGVIHRDLKPANVMIGAFGEVLVMDWGIARDLGTCEEKAPEVAGSSTNVDSARTLEGSVVGTPGYMSPEQIEGRISDIDERSDVYGLGAMIYETLTGTRPHTATTIEALRGILVKGVWEPPSRRAPEAGIPHELDAMVAKAMHRDPAMRYRDVLAVKREIEAHLAGRPLLAFRYTAWHRAGKWVNRNKILAAFLGSVSILIPLLAMALVSSVRANAAARANAERADEQLRDVLALSEASGVDEILEEEARIQAWRGYPRDLANLERWIAAAIQFEGRLSYHQAKLVEIETRSERRASDRWELRNRENLVQRLGELATALVEARAAIAKGEELQARMERGPDRSAWDEARGEGLELPRMAGLAPIGRDPTSGLWEFWVVESGERPQRGADGVLELVPETGIVLVLLPGGSFRMGSSTLPSEQPVTQVAISPFLLSKYEMTRAQWKRATETDPSYFQSGTPRAPVEQVSWDECRRALSRWGLSLPSESEWEYAARAGSTGDWWTTDLAAAGNVADRAGIRYGLTQGENWDDGEAFSCRVGKYLPNAFGLHDTIGNVWEWCEDAYYEDLSKTPADGSPNAGANPTDRVFRGGSYAWTAASARSAFRFRFARSLRCYDLGVRPAMRVR